MKNLFVLLFLLFCSYKRSNANDLLTVKDISIEERSNSSSEAKQLGINTAKKEAFQIVLNRIMISSDANKELNNFSSDDINSFISEIKISNEQTSATKYKANIDISFGVSLIGGYLKNKGYKFINDTPINTMMIPVVIGRNNDILLYQTDKLIESINNYKKSLDNIIPIIIPVNVRNLLPIALKDDIDTINNLAEQYNAASSIIVKVSNFGEKTVKIGILKTDTFSSNNIEWTLTENVDIYNVLSKLIIQISNDIYKTDTINGKGYKGELIAIFGVKSIKDILKIEQILSNTDYINSVFIKAISQNMIQILLKTKTNKKSVINSLIKKGFIVEDKDQYILIK